MASTDFLPLVPASQTVINTGVQVAIIAGIFSLMGILLSFLLDRGRPAPPNPLPTPAPPKADDELVAELRDRIESLKRSFTRCEAERQAYRDELVRHNIDLPTVERRRAKPRRDTS